MMRPHPCPRCPARMRSPRSPAWPAAAATTTRAPRRPPPRPARPPRRRRGLVRPSPSNPANGSTTITVGSKNFTEQKVLGEIYAQALAAAGYKVEQGAQPRRREDRAQGAEVRPDRRLPRVHRARRCCRSSTSRPTSCPRTRRQAYDAGQGRLRQARHHGPAADAVHRPPTRSALTQEKAKKLGLTKISDLEGKSQNLTLYGTPECRQRLDCLLGLEKVYGLKFKKFVPVDLALRHEVLEKGQADVSIVFTTDPQIKRDKLVLLKDDKGMFPPYNSTFLRQAVDPRQGRARTSQKTIDAGQQGPDRRRRCRSSTRASTSTRRRRPQVAERVPEGVGLREGLTQRPSGRGPAGQRPDEPNPPAARAVSPSSSTSTTSGVATATSTSWAIRSPALDGERLARGRCSAAGRAARRGSPRR